MLKVTVCELNNEPEDFVHDWEQLVAHVRTEASDLVLLPEMPFYPWIAWTRQVDPAVWQASVKAHDDWMTRLRELAPAIVLGSRPVIKEGKRLNEGFLWEPDSGYRTVHTKYYLPDEEGFWEASWYQRGNREFVPIQSSKAKIGMLICTEQWFTEHARAYAKAGVHLLISPRATPMSSADKWVAGGRAAAVMSGAFCLSSNLRGFSKYGTEMAGKGWIIEPEEGDVLALTSQSNPFVTKEIDLRVAEHAKQTYPRYVLE
jgi:N-carbamoylputrescine amidase